MAIGYCNIKIEREALKIYERYPFCFFPNANGRYLFFVREGLFLKKDSNEVEYNSYYPILGKFNIPFPAKEGEEYIVGFSGELTGISHDGGKTWEIPGGGFEISISDFIFYKEFFEIENGDVYLKNKLPVGGNKRWKIVFNDDFSSYLVIEDLLKNISKTSVNYEGLIEFIKSRSLKQMESGEQIFYNLFWSVAEYAPEILFDNPEFLEYFSYPIRVKKNLVSSYAYLERLAEEDFIELFYLDLPEAILESLVGKSKKFYFMSEKFVSLVIKTGLMEKFISKIITGKCEKVGENFPCKTFINYGRV